MNIMGMGIPELLVILLIAMIVAGPKRLMQWAYISGRFMGQMRVMWGQMMSSIQREFDDAGLDIKMPKDPLNRSQVQQFTRDALRPLSDPMRQAMHDYEREARALEKEIREADKLDVEEVTDDSAEIKKAASPPPPAQKPKSFGTWGGTTLDEE